MTHYRIVLFTVLLIVNGALAKTVKPALIVEEYNVTLSNPGPAFCGSNVTFQAQLYSGTREVPKDTKYFKYQWESSADHLTETQNANFKTNLTKCYSLADPGIYKMTLKVFKDDLFDKKMVATATQKFKLTNRLNGYLNSSQASRKHETDSVFSTDEFVHVKLNVTDIFTESPPFRYTWYLNNTSYITTTFPSHLFSIHTPGVYRVKVKVLSEDTVLDCNMEEWLQPEGRFETDLHMYDPVGGIQIVGKNKVKNTTYVRHEVYFNGSAPFNISWVVVNMKTSHTVKQGLIMNWNGSSPVTIKLNKTLTDGQYYFSATVQNPVSLLMKRHNFTVAERFHVDCRLCPEICQSVAPTHSAAVIVLPLIGGLALVTLILAAVYVVLPRWKGKHVETADFDFHPSLRLPSRPNTEENESLMVTVKSVFRKMSKGSEDDIGVRRGSRAQRPNSYGSLGTSMET